MTTRSEELIDMFMDKVIEDLSFDMEREGDFIYVYADYIEFGVRRCERLTDGDQA